MACVEHVLQQRYSQREIVIVDNGSTDDSVRRFKEIGRLCRLITLDSNRGFAGGMNSGLRQAVAESFDYVWVVNNDAFAESSCLATLVERMQHDSKLVMAVPRLVSRDGTEQHAGGIVDWSSGETRYLATSDMTETLPDGCWLTGTAPLLRTSALRTVGLFEPAFFAYVEDIDLSVRLARAGGKLRAVPDAQAMHLGGATSGGAISATAQFLYTRNVWLLLERHAHVGSRRARWLRFAAISTKRAALYEAENRPDLAKAVTAGISAARRRTFGPPPPVIRPAARETLFAKRPWRSAQLMGRLADWLEPPATPYLHS
jgi:GT2 family glycosyltransferase